MARLKERLAREEGFTLIELLVVIIIIAILLAIAIPSYLGFRDKANQRAAQADVRAAIPSAEGFFSDNNTYTGMTKTVLLASYDAGLKLGKAGSEGTVVPATNGNSYCISAFMGGWWAHAQRPPVPTATTDEDKGEPVLASSKQAYAGNDPCASFTGVAGT